MDERTTGRTVELFGIDTVKTAARAQAARAVERILDRGAYSNVVVRGAVVRPESDHGFYQRLVYTSLRHLPFIDAQIANHASRPIETMDATVRAVLRVGVAEVTYLGTLDHAVVHEAVETVRTLGRAQASGFVNAVLRKVVATHASPTGGLDEDYPEAVRVIAHASLGQLDGDVFLAASNMPAPVGIRFRDRSLRSGSRYAGPDDDVNALEAAGMVDVIDPASVMSVAALDLRPGDRVVDLAAAPGGKTRAIADQVGGNGRVIGIDRHSRRLTDAARRSASLPNITWLVADAARPPLAARSFDRVLLDAPCTGLGTMRRRPEIRFRVLEDAPRRYGQVQRSLLESALELAAPGGRVVYSVCTITNEETIDVIDGLGFHRPANIAGEPRGEGVLLAPHTTGTDGMFIAVKDM